MKKIDLCCVTTSMLGTLEAETTGIKETQALRGKIGLGKETEVITKFLSIFFTVEFLWLFVNFKQDEKLFQESDSGSRSNLDRELLKGRQMD